MKINEIIGQKKIINQLMMQTKYYKEYRKTSFPHTLLIASAGQGKTTIAKALADILSDNFIEAYAPNLKTEEDMANLFVKNNRLIPENSVIFIDEIHALSLKLTETLYTLMENFTLALEGESVSFPRFTLIAGTTEPQLMSKPLRDRFVNTFLFEPYTDEDMSRYIDNYKLNVKISKDVKPVFARLSKYTPRLMNSLLEKAGCYMYYNGITELGSNDIDGFLSYAGYTKDGLTELEKRYISILKDKGIVSVGNISNMLGLKENMVSTIIEPSLLSIGAIEITSSGRSLTEKGKQMC